MNELLGILLGFLLWSLMGYVFSWFLLHLYDGSRLPNDEMSSDANRESNRKYNRALKVKDAIGGGLVVGGFWYLFIHHNPLISN